MIKYLKNVNLFIIISIIGILIQIIKCETGECTSCEESGCRYFTEKNKCYTCTLENEENFYHFTIEDNEGEDEISCSDEGDNNSNNFKLIANKKELVENCPNGYFQLGSICYQTKPNNVKEIEENTNRYECIYSYTKKIENNLEYIQCLNRGQSCPSEFDHRTINQDKNIMCSTECFIEGSDNVFKYKEIDEQNNIFYYCLSTGCSSSVKYKNETSSNIIECLENCNSLETGEFSNSENKCVDNGEGECIGYIKVDINKNHFECITTATNCPIDYPYLYTNNGDSKKYCLKNCLDTQKITFFNNKKTYLYEDVTSKECLTEKDNYYKDELALKFTNDCKNSLSGPYHNDSDHICYKWLRMCKQL